MVEKMERRDFIVKSSIAVCGAGLLAGAKNGPAAGRGPKSRVVEVTHDGAVKDNRKIQKQAVTEMIKSGMSGLTGSNNPWSQFLKPTDKVGLKISTLGRPLLVTHHEFIAALADELIAFGIKENNIIVWDRFEDHMEAGRFAINHGSKGVRYLGSEAEINGKKTMRYDLKAVYVSDDDNPDRRDEKYGNTSPFSEILIKDCDKVINLALLKDHGLAGVTLCLKNLAFGVTTNNARFHGPAHIGPFIADICARPEVNKKTVLHILDGLEGCFDSGPVPRNQGVLFTPKTLWFSTDPVALDALGRQVIEEQRKKKGILSLAAARRPVDHIELAAKKGLGQAKIEQLDLKKTKLG